MQEILERVLGPVCAMAITMGLFVFNDVNISNPWNLLGFAVMYLGLTAFFTWLIFWLYDDI
jgi:hypothetical protein